MRTSTVALASGLAATATAAETIHGVLVFTRHGDRTTKHYGSQQLTSLGAKQCFQSGSFYRNRYLSPDSTTQISGIDGEQYTRSQIYATAPDADILLNTATAFLQGLYPPLASEGVTTLNNGTKISSPLSNYQYVTLHGVSSSSPDTIWLKGDESCPAASTAQSAYKKSQDHLSLLSSTKPFYESFYPYLSAVYDYPSASSLSYAAAYDIFDLINVARIHNSTGPARDIPSADLFQLRTLADRAEFNTNYNASEPNRQIGGRALAGAVLKHLGDTVNKGQRKFTLLAGSYDTFLAWFGWAGLTEASPDFFGLPEYGGSMVFEVFSEESGADNNGNQEKRVRWLFRNGTEDAVELKGYPLFGLNKPDLAWTEFEKVVKEKGSISGPEEWCGACGSREGFCKMYNAAEDSSEGIEIKKDGGMDGEMIAGIVLIVVGGLALVSAVAMWVFVNSMRKKTKGGDSTTVTMNAGKGAEGWESGSFTRSQEKVTV